MKKILLVGASLILLGGMMMAEDGDGKKAIPEGGRGYGFVDINNDGVNDLRGTKAGTGAGNGRVNQNQTTRPIMGAGTQSHGGQGQGRGRR